MRRLALAVALLIGLAKPIWHHFYLGEAACSRHIIRAGSSIINALVFTPMSETN